ncbi:MAG: hypothetical protein ACX98W_13205 [bacterium]
MTFDEAAITRRQPDRVELTWTGRAGSLAVTARTTIEYDGMVRIELQSSEDSDVSIDRFAYVFELSSPLFEWFNHHVPYDYAALNVDKKALLESAGPIASGESRFEFSPTLFLGGREVGIEWWWESNVQWTRQPGDTPLRIRRGNSITSLMIEPISERRKIDPAHPFTHEFALFPTPLRPAPERWRSTRFISYQAARQFRSDLDLRFYWIAFPKHFSALYHGLPNSRRDKDQIDLREKLASLRVGYIPYAKLTAVPSAHPRALARTKDWAANDQLFMVPPPNERRIIQRTTDWKPGQSFGYAVCAESTEYLDWIRTESVRAYREERLDGLYYDFGSISRMCERASDAPGDSPTEAGRTKPEFWHYFNLREFYKDLDREMAQIDPDGILTIHTHGQPRALSAWADFTFIGEALNVEFRKGRRFPEIANRPDLYTPDYLALPEGWMDALTFPRVGGITSWLPQLGYAKDDENPERLERYQRAFFAWLLVNDAHAWLGNGDFPAMVEIMRAIDRFGSLDAATVLPWWRNQQLIQHDSRLKVTAYVRDRDNLLLVISNLGSKMITSHLQLATGLVGNRHSLSVSDLEKPRNRKMGIAEERAFQVSVPARNFRLIQVEATGTSDQ